MRYIISFFNNLHTTVSSFIELYWHFWKHSAKTIRSISRVQEHSRIIAQRRFAYKHFYTVSSINKQRQKSFLIPRSVPVGWRHVHITFLISSLKASRLLSMKQISLRQSYIKRFINNIYIPFDIRYKPIRKSVIKYSPFD